MRTITILIISATAVLAKHVHVDLPPIVGFVKKPIWGTNLHQTLYFEEGNAEPFLPCEGPKGQTVKCRVTDEEPMGPEPLELACYSAHHGTGNVFAKGCWIHQRIALEDCSMDNCIERDSDVPVKFCCCREGKCNRQVIKE